MQDFGLFRVRIRQVSQYQHMDKTLKMHYKQNQQMYENYVNKHRKRKMINTDMITQILL